MANIRAPSEFLSRKLRILEKGGKIIGVWPINSNDSKNTNLISTVLWIVQLATGCLLWLAMFSYAYYNSEDLMITLINVPKVGACTEMLLDLILCRINSSKLQSVLDELRNFLQASGEMENEVLQKYLNRYFNLFRIIFLSNFSCGAVFCIAPIFTGQDFPSESWFPFSTEPLWIHAPLYIVESFAVNQIAMSVIVDLTIAILFSFSSIRFDILSVKLERATNYEELTDCIKEHQKIIEFVKDVRIAIGPLLFKTLITKAICFVCIAIPLLYDPPLDLVAQFVTLVLSMSGRMIVLFSTADSVGDCSLRIGNSLLAMSWIGKSPRMLSSLLIMLQRSQKPLRITVSSILPAITLEFCLNFFTKVASYFMALRTVMVDNDILKV